MKKPIIKKYPERDHDTTKRPNMGNGGDGTPENNPMGDTAGMLPSFARAIHTDFVFADTCAPKNPFKADWNKIRISYIGPKDE